MPPAEGAANYATCGEMNETANVTGAYGCGYFDEEPTEGRTCLPAASIQPLPDMLVSREAHHTHTSDGSAINSASSTACKDLHNGIPREMHVEVDAGHSTTSEACGASGKSPPGLLAGSLAEYVIHGSPDIVSVGTASGPANNAEDDGKSVADPTVSTVQGSNAVETRQSTSPAGEKIGMWGALQNPSRSLRGIFSRAAPRGEPRKEDDRDQHLSTEVCTFCVIVGNISLMFLR